MKQTAVEWLLNEFQEAHKDFGGLDLQWLNKFEQAKEIEKQQIIDAYNNCIKDRYNNALVDMGFKEKSEKMHEQNNITIIDFIKQKEYDLSVRAKNVLKYTSHLYTYMNELSVARLVKIRNCGLKSIKEIIHVYPNLENEIGSLSTIAVKKYFDKKAKEINLNKEALAFVEFVCSSKNKIGYHEGMKKWYIYDK